MRNYNKLHKAALDKQSNGPRHVWKNYLDDLLLIIVAGEPEATAESYTTPAREKQGALSVAIDLLTKLFISADTSMLFCADSDSWLVIGMPPTKYHDYGS